jgi:methionyl-tRNA synthetase
MKNKYYITTTLPYVNAEPHIGFALEIIQADVIARYKHLTGYETIFNFGTDEHGLKIYRKAIAEKKDPQLYCDEYALKFNNLKKALNLGYTHFIRTSDKKHIKAAQKFWQICYANGDIYKKHYKIKYCVGCELEKTDSELEKGICPIHPNQQIELINEENYFFRFSKYQNKLLDFYRKNPDFVIPQNRYREIINFVKKGLTDFSISRLKEKMPWGIDVPDDPKHVMYVWFDALINYVSTLGWPDNNSQYDTFWPGYQVAGKDNLRQQTAIWQAMLMSAKLPNSKQVFIHGFITNNGQKISKSTGNTVDPTSITEKYGTDALRYYLLSQIPSYDDGDFSMNRFIEVYNSNLANGIGNLVSRIAKLCEKTVLSKKNMPSYDPNIAALLDKYKFDEAMKIIWDEIKKTDIYLNEKKPWKIRNPKDLNNILETAVNKVIYISYNLAPFLPETADIILKHFMKTDLKSLKPLFPRI